MSIMQTVEIVIRREQMIEAHSAVISGANTTAADIVRTEAATRVLSELA
jgi:hypothetical protein